jgi:hypothetical protein
MDLGEDPIQQKTEDEVLIKGGILSIVCSWSTYAFFPSLIQGDEVPQEG